VGALYVRPRTPFLGQILGGSQERNRRAGTEDVAGAVGLATALRRAEETRATTTRDVGTLRDYLWAELPRRLPGLRLNGPGDFSRRLPNNLSVCIGGVEGESVLIQLDLNGIAASSGSACTTGSLEPSHVLTAMGVPADMARSSLRLSLGKDNTRAEVDALLAALPVIVDKLRRLAPAQPAS
jgi:cysteine desulfurase